MSKIVECPVKRFPGTITLRDPMSFLLLEKWREASEITQGEKDKSRKFALIEKTFYPLVWECVEKWELKNILPDVTLENFPNASPGTGAKSTHTLIAWLINQCHKIYEGDEGDDPNA